MVRRLAVAVAVVAALTVLSPAGALAGRVFLTGHDPDFHSQPGAGSPGAGNLFRAGLSFVTSGTYDDGAATKFLWVESFVPVPGGHLRGEDGLNAIGLTLGTNYDWVDALGFASVNLSNYTAVGIASSFGGMLTRAELDALIARKTDIKNFINAGGGLFASAECDNCGADLLGMNPNLFGYLPVTVTSIGANPPFTVTAYGAATHGLTNADMNDPTHNSFGLVGGLNIVDTDAAGKATTLSGIVTVDDGGFTAVPLPGTLVLLGIGLVGLGWRRR